MSRVMMWSIRKSMGARRLRKALDIKAIKHKNSRYIPKDGDIIINWGMRIYPNIPRLLNVRWINPPNIIITNKLKVMKVIGGKYRTVPYTESRWVAREWVKEGYVVYVRHMLNGKGGKGIEIILPQSGSDYMPLAGMYTRQVIGREFRIHVGFGKIIDIREKVKMNSDRLAQEGLIESDEFIKNLHNGWIFKKDTFINNKNLDIAIEIVDKLGYDFGALDVIIDNNDNMYFLEINSAPGIINSTVDKYKQVFTEALG